MDASALAAAVEEDKRKGSFRSVWWPRLHNFDIQYRPRACDRRDLRAACPWLHVDAAYAGSAAVVPELRYVLDGCARADSLAVNPHKWLFTPFDLSVLYCRHMDLLRRAFSLVPNICVLRAGKGAQRIRLRCATGARFRALKLWMIIRYFGHEGLAARIREHCRLAQLFASWVEQSHEWELMAPVPLGLVAFELVLKLKLRMNQFASESLMS